MSKRSMSDVRNVLRLYVRRPKRSTFNLQRRTQNIERIKDEATSDVKRTDVEGYIMDSVFAMVSSG